MPEGDFAERKVADIPRIYQRLADTIAPFRQAEGYPPQKLLPFMRWALEGAGTQIWLAIAASISVGVTTVIGFWLIGWVIDKAQSVGPGFLASHFWAVVLLAVFYLVIWPLAMAANAAFNSVTLGPNLYALTLNRLNRYTLGQSLTYFDNDFAGRIAQKSQQTGRALTEVVTEGTNILGNALAAAISAAVMLGAVDWRLGLAVAVWIVAYVYLVKHFLPRIRERSQLRAARRAVVTGQIVDTITNIRTVKLFAHGDAEETATEGALSGYRESGIAWASTVVTFRLWIFTLAGLLPTFLIILSLWLWSRGMATTGDIAAAGLISTRLATMTGWVSFASLGIFTNIGEIEDGIRTLTPRERLEDAPDATDLVITNAEVDFKDVTFTYGRDSGGVQGLNLAIAPGEKLGIVGASGAGKSTLVALLLRLYAPEGGRIEIDGQDTGHVTQESLRRQISMVTQETAMFNRSARDNILYGRPNATDEEMIAAAKKAEAHDFILGLKDHRGRSGYEAHLGERGVKLSGGQRQRIALARAIVKDAPILVLDEATSALDSEVEASIQQALHRVMEGKTVLAIAHRLSTLSEMDRIVVLDQGQIAEAGSHSELLAMGGLYAQYWSRQSGGFIQTDPADAAAE
ncbi:MAG: multidrug ABC transporter ATP-binding protein [Rhodobacteraceae bacterium]|nr:multidrug ABC transporter ATP-binding protein [Paracoccaceae bacterium]MAY45764.1 multidrug ABC transporter ATP-binding protein [Paracoccaceae bacterium]